MVRTTDAAAQPHHPRFHLPAPHLPHGLVTFPRPLSPWIEPWFFAYACLGIVQGGMLPMLLPLSAGGSIHAGAIVGVMNFAGLTSPFWGHLADRRRLHRQVLLAGILAVLAALVLMPMQLHLPLKAGLAAILGLGFAAANTVANMFIVEVWPREEWDARIGALQATSGIGQVGGLLLAGLIGGRFALAFGVAAALVAAAAPIAWLTLRKVQLPVPRDAVAAHPPIGGEGWAGAPQRQFHLPSWSGLGRLRRKLELPFARLQIVWFAAFIAISSVLTLFPLALIREFGVADGVPATAYAFAATGGLTGYPLAARLAKRHGAWFVLRAGFALRSLAIAMLCAGFLWHVQALPAALAGFIALVLGWPLLGVSGTALTAQLAPGEKGEALGLFNASSSLAGGIGALLGGWAMERAGYGMVCLVAAGVVAVAVLFSGATAEPARTAP